jgi:gamma-F420-2:alpha-L-glutamate ligase
MSKQLKGWLIYKKQDAEKNHGFIKMLVEEATELHISLQLVLEEDLFYGIKDNQFVLSHPTQDAKEVSFAIVRTINPLLTKQLEYIGIRCFNNSTISEICNDKALTYQFATKLGLPILDTYFISHETFQPERFALEFPLVLKQVDGRGGNEVYLIQTLEEIIHILNEYPHKRFVLQEFADNPGKDIRVFVIGTDVIGAVLRESSTSFKANYTLGGNVSAYMLNEAENILVSKITSSLKADFIGIDFLLNSKNEFIFNEIEDVVGCRSLYSTSDVNAARLYMNHIKNEMKKGVA